MSELREGNDGDAEWSWVRAAYLATPPADARAPAAVVAKVVAAARGAARGPQGAHEIGSFRKPRHLWAGVGIAAAVVAAVLLTPRHARLPTGESISPGVAIAPQTAASSRETSDTVTSRPAPARPGNSTSRSSDSTVIEAAPITSPEARVATLGARGHPSLTTSDTAALLGVDAKSYTLLHGGLGHSAFADLVTIASAARAEGLPVAPIADRAVQGVRRNISDSVVLATARGVVARLTTARRALGPRSTNDELTAGADALFVGATAQMLTSLRRSREAGAALVPLIVLTDLMTNGIAAEAAADAVQAMISARPASHAADVDAGMLAMRTEVAADVAKGAAPTAALLARLRHRTENFPAAPRTGTTIPQRSSPGVPAPKPPESF